MMRTYQQKMLFTLMKALVASCMILAMGSVQAYHFPWDQGHDTTDWNDPPPPGPCEGPNCDPCNSTNSPVYAPTGHFIWSETDLVLNGTPIIKLRRTYNSSDPRNGIFGNGWTAGCEIALVRNVKVQNQYLLKWGNGKRYIYSENNGEFSSPNGRFDSIEQLPNGHVGLVSPDGGRLEFNSNGKLVADIDPNGNQKNYTYDTQTGLLIETSTPDGRYIKYFYNSSGRVSTVTDSTGRNWDYSYDVNGNLVSVANPLGNTRTYTYQDYKPVGDSYVYQHLTKIVDESGVVVTDVAYTNDQVLSYTNGADKYSYQFDKVNRTVKRSDSLGRVWTSKYNTRQQIELKVDPLGNSELFDYDSSGLLDKYTDQLGRNWLSTRDTQGRITTKTKPNGKQITYEYVGSNAQPSKITTASGRIAEIIYDENYNASQVKDNIGETTQITSDEFGNPIRVVDPLGNQTKTTYNAANLPIVLSDELGREATLKYDNRGNIVSVTNPAQEKRTYKYDLLDRLVELTNANGGKIIYEYDAAGRLTILTDPAGKQWRFEYDAYGRKSKEINPANHVTEFTYSNDNKITRILRPDGSQILNTFDSANRLVAKNVDGSNVTYTYDKRGNVASVVQNGVTYTLSYDEIGNLLAESGGPFNHSVSYKYNEEGELLGYSTNTGVDVTYSRDTRGFISSIIEGANSYNISYDEIGRKTKTILPNGKSIIQDYDAIGRIKSIGYDTLQNLQYEFDMAGRITRKSGNSFDWQYGYDQVSRLVHANNGGDNYEYIYDDLGNSLDNGSQYNSLNQLIEDNEFTYQYDLRGNLFVKISKSVGSKSVFQWGARNELVGYEFYPNASTTAPTNVANYQYDPFGRRIEKSVNGVATSYQWAGSWLIAEYEGNNLLRQYTYVDGEFTPISMTDSSGTYDVHSDHLGAPVFLTDMQGTVVWRASYSPYGDAVVDEDPDGDGTNIVFNFRYPGQYYDEETGLNYNYFRYYDPKLGRYISSDPIEEMKDINLYVYSGSNPVSNMDVLGLAWGSAAAIWHFYFGKGASVSLQTTGHYGAVTTRIQTQRDSFKRQAEMAAESKARSLGCNTSSHLSSGTSSVGANSGVFWIGGFSLFRQYDCALSKTCKDAQMCPPQKIKTYSYSCRLHFWMRDRFEDPSDLDNTKGGPNEDFWDDWEYGGTPFDVTGDWYDKVSGSGQI